MDALKADLFAEARRLGFAAVGIAPAGEDATAAARLEGWLADPDAAALPPVGEVCLRSADPDDLTLRQARWLGSADCIAHEPGVPAAVLDRARADAGRLPIRPGEMPAGMPGFTVILRA